MFFLQAVAPSNPNEIWPWIATTLCVVVTFLFKLMWDGKNKSHEREIKIKNEAYEEMRGEKDKEILRLISENTDLRNKNDKMIIEVISQAKTGQEHIKANNVILEQVINILKEIDRAIIKNERS